MIEFLILGFLGLAGVACTAILAFLLVRSGWRLDRRRAKRAEQSELGNPPWPEGDRGLGAPRTVEILSIMREHFPFAYARVRDGELSAEERLWVWDSCRAIADARVEIEEMCGSR